MNIDIKKSFSKDVDKIHDKKLLNLIAKTISHIELAKSFKDIKHIKKMEGSKKHYRIKIGDYRLGLFVENKIVFLVRFFT